jgi:hypothetical protein
LSGRFPTFMRKISEWCERSPSYDRIDLKLREVSPWNEKCSDRCNVLQMVLVGRWATGWEITDNE